MYIVAANEKGIKTKEIKSVGEDSILTKTQVSTHYYSNSEVP